MSLKRKLNVRGRATMMDHSKSRFVITIALAVFLWAEAPAALARRAGPVPSAERILAEARLEHVLSTDTAFIEEKLAELTGEREVEIAGVRMVLGSRHTRAKKDAALAYLAAEYRKLGFTTELASYASGINLIAERPGRIGERVFVVGAHYDTVATVGADDDGSGVIGSLAIAHALRNLELDYSLRIVAFDEEERGLIGSAAYVEALATSGKLDELIGSLVLEMLGYDSDHDGAFHIVDCANRRQGALHRSEHISRLLIAAVREASLPLTRIQACTTRSDHTNFWRFGKPAVVISQNFFGGDSNPCYHNSCDRMDRLNFDYMTHLTSAAASAVASLLASSP